MNVIDMIKQGFSQAVDKDKFKSIVYVEALRLILMTSLVACLIGLLGLSFVIFSLLEVKQIDLMIAYSFVVALIVVYIMSNIYYAGIMSFYGDIAQGKKPRIIDFGNNLQTKGLSIVLMKIVEDLFLIIFSIVPALIILLLVRTDLMLFGITISPYMLSTIIFVIMLIIANTLKNIFFGLIIPAISYERGIFSRNLKSILKTQIKAIPSLLFANILLFIIKIAVVLSFFMFGIGIYMYIFVYAPATKFIKMNIYKNLKM